MLHSKQSEALHSLPPPTLRLRLRLLLRMLPPSLGWPREGSGDWIRFHPGWKTPLLCPKRRCRGMKEGLDCKRWCTESIDACMAGRMATHWFDPLAGGFK